MKILFENFLNDRELYKQNIKFWKDIVEKIISVKQLETKKYPEDLYHDQKWFWDGNPIYDCRIESINKQLSIVQTDVADPDITHPFCLWIDKRETEEDVEILELCLYLELSYFSVAMSINAIYMWFVEDLNKEDMEKYMEKIEDLSENIMKLYNN